MIFDAADYGAIHEAVFAMTPAAQGPQGVAVPRYPGYRPEVLEVPNGDGRVDRQKRFAHVALKYLEKLPRGGVSSTRNLLEWFLARAHWEACRIAEALEVPPEFYPRAADGTLRILDYPAGVGYGEEHTDFDLFTVCCYRSHPDALKLNAGPLPESVERQEAEMRAYGIDPRLHIGEIGELVGLGPATPHYVEPRPEAQQSIVYFAIPDHRARFPHVMANVDKGAWHGRAVGEWIAERIARSRVPAVKP